HQAIEHISQGQIGAGLITLVFFVLQVSADIRLINRLTGQLCDLLQLGIADVEQVTQAAQDVVVGHSVALWGKLAAQYTARTPGSGACEPAVDAPQCSDHLSETVPGLLAGDYPVRA